jgi:hypothetical protein
MQSLTQSAMHNKTMKSLHMIAGGMSKPLYQFADALLGFPSRRQAEEHRAKRHKPLGLRQDDFSLSRETFLGTGVGVSEVKMTQKKGPAEFVSLGDHPMSCTPLILRQKEFNEFAPSPI